MTSNSMGGGMGEIDGDGLRVGAIERALKDVPHLCSEALVVRGKDGRVCARCAIGQLLHVAGVGSLHLFRLELWGESGNDAAIWRRYGPLLHKRFGFLSARQVGALMEVNDDATEENRLARVMNEVERMAKSGWR